MTSKQYEELCRYFLANQLGIGIDKVISVDIPNPLRTDLPGFKHQIDLYWETSDSLALYVNIANAKWRGSSKVDQPDVLLLQQVKQKVAAHKAVMLTNSEFTAGAVAAAMDDGIALHIVRPEFDFSALAAKNPDSIRHEIQSLAETSGKPLYSHEVVHKAFDLAAIRTGTFRSVAKPLGGTGPRESTGYQTKVVTTLPNKSLGGGKSGPSKGPGSWPGYRTK